MKKPLKAYVMYVRGAHEIYLREEKIESASLKIIAEQGAHVTIIDDRVYTEQALNVSLEILAQANAYVRYFDRRSYNPTAHVRSELRFNAKKDSTINAVQWDQTAQEVSCDVVAELSECNADISMKFGAKLYGDQKHTVTSKQLHKAPHTKSRSIVKTAVYDIGSSIYHGMIEVEPSAKQTEAFQDHKTILMSEKAHAYAKPSIEVHADEVQCGHGSAIGQLDEEHIFYLLSRGFDAKSTEQLLIDAFFKEFSDG